MSVFFVCLVFLFNLFICEDFIVLSFYESQDCSSSSYQSKWFLKCEDPSCEFCTDKPFGDGNDVKLEYVKKGDVENTEKIVYTTYKSGKGCTGEIDQQLDLDLEFCQQIHRIHKSWNIKFSITNEFPYNITSIAKENWIVEKMYPNSECHSSKDSISQLYAGYRYRFEKDHFGTSYWGIGGFCSDEDIVLFGDFSDRYHSVNLIPRKTYENKCIRTNDQVSLLFYDMNLLENSQNTFHQERVNSTIYTCYNEQNTYQEFLEHDNTKQHVNHNEFFKQIKSYDANCNNFFNVDFLGLGVCIEKSVCHATPSNITTITYDEVGCKRHSPVSVFTVTEIPSKCSKLHVDDEQKLPFPVYSSFELTTEPYLPQNTAFIRVNLSCHKELTDLMKNPENIPHIFSFGVNGESGLEYVDERYCNTDCSILGGDQSTHCSFQTSCENGKLSIIRFYQSDTCIGPYTVQKGLKCRCAPNADFGYVHMTCIPRFCFQYDETSPKVCNNGKGKCVARNYCECIDGYFGDECEHWSCNGIQNDFDHVCSGNGHCRDYNDCVCKEGSSGRFCANTFAKIWMIGLGIGMGTLVCLGGLACCCCIQMLFCCFMVVFCCCVKYLLQQRRIYRYQKLDDFDLILREQQMEKDNTIAHLNINKKLFEVNFEEIKVISTIGSGGSDSIVFKAKFHGQIVAFKCFKTRKILSNQLQFDQFETEVKIIANINHPNIIRFFGASLKSPRVGIVMEYCENGELLEFFASYAKSRGEGYPVRRKLIMCIEIISAMTYLHSRDIIHRDLKSENILVDASFRTKIMDFGISKFYKKGSSSDQKTKRIGTSIYMAPEILHGEYDEKCDVFSFGILLWVIFTENESPYGKKNYQIEFKVANDPNFRPDTTQMSLPSMFGEGKCFEWVKDIMISSWNVDSQQRKSFQEMYDEFIKKEKQICEIYNVRDDEVRGYGSLDMTNVKKAKTCKTHSIQ